MLRIKRGPARSACRPDRPWWRCAEHWRIADRARNV